jgi:hypothetical protein
VRAQREQTKQLVRDVEIDVKLRREIERAPKVARSYGCTLTPSEPEKKVTRRMRL